MKCFKEDELTETRNKRRLKLKHSTTDMASFCLSLRQECPIMTKNEIEALRPSLHRICVRLASLL
jgi:hypothetical protein